MYAQIIPPQYGFLSNRRWRMQSSMKVHLDSLHGLWVYMNFLVLPSQ